MNDPSSYLGRRERELALPETRPPQSITEQIAALQAEVIALKARVAALESKPRSWHEIMNTPMDAAARAAQQEVGDCNCFAYQCTTSAVWVCPRHGQQVRV